MCLPLTIKPWRCLNLPARFTGSRLNRAFQIADSLRAAKSRHTQAELRKLREIKRTLNARIAK